MAASLSLIDKEVTQVDVPTTDDWARRQMGDIDCEPFHLKVISWCCHYCRLVVYVGVYSSCLSHPIRSAMESVHVFILCKSVDGLTFSERYCNEV